MNAVRNYTESYYSADIERMKDAIHPDINKAEGIISDQTEETVFNYFTYSAILENVVVRDTSGVGNLPEINVEILKSDDNFANAKVKTFAADSIATVSLKSPILKISPSHIQIEIPYIFGFTLASSGIYEATLPFLIFLILEYISSKTFSILLLSILVNIYI